MSSPLDAVSAYILAKDGNRPFLMRHAFTEDAELEMVVRTDAISFPSSAKGREALEDILVRRFANDFENIYTFCLSRPSAAHRHHFPCHWLVGMSAKTNGPIRVGCGRYDWYFTSDDRCRVERLVIDIDVMQTLPASALDEVTSWLSQLPYPWCTPEAALEAMPKVGDLASVEQYLRTARPISAA